MKSDLDWDSKAAVRHMKASACCLFLVSQGSDSKTPSEKPTASPLRKVSVAREILHVGYPTYTLCTAAESCTDTDKQLTADDLDGCRKG